MDDDNCPTCKGTGEVIDLPPGGRDQYYGPSVCPTCKGTKKKPPTMPPPPPMQGVMKLTDCIPCKGQGTIPGQTTAPKDLRYGGATCQDCAGSGRVRAHPTSPMAGPFPTPSNPPANEQNFTVV